MSSNPVKIHPHVFHHLSEKDKKNYIFFSVHTQGRRGGAGRELFIDPRLLPVFLSYVDPDSHEGKMTIRKIEQLRALAGTVGSMSNVYNSFEHMSVVNNIQVYYQINDGKVYITNITSDFKGGGRSAGLYEVSDGGGFSRIRARPIANNKLPEHLKGVFISGAVPDIDTATKRCLELSKKQNIKQALFYYPSYMVNSLGIWKSSALEARAQSAITKLAEVIKHNKNIKSTWLAEAEGAALLARSLKGVNGPLEKLSIRLANPIGNLSGLLATLKQKKADFQPQESSLDTKHRASYVSVLALQPKLFDSLNLLPGQKDEDKKQAQAISRSMQQTLGKTFVDAARQVNKLIPTG